MAWISSQASEASHSHSVLGSEQSLTVSRTDTLNLSYFQEYQKESCTKHLSGMTCKLSAEKCCRQLILFSEDSPARISVLQDLEKAWAASEVDFSSRLSDLQKKLERRLCSSKTSPQLELEDFEKSSEHLPKSGMTVGGRVYLPQALEPLTKEKDGSYWPTPTAQTYGSNKGGAAGRTGKERLSLETMARKNLWPTPTASDYRKRGPSSKQQGLPETVMKHHPNGGQLNPRWVELLMGYPENWTEIYMEFSTLKQKKEPQKFCQTCHKETLRKRYNGRLEDLTAFQRRKFCSLSCANTRQVIGYHGMSWRARQHLKEACERCSTKEGLHAHHCDEDRSNNTSENIQTLCGSCHNWWHHEAKRLGQTPSGRAPCHE